MWNTGHIAQGESHSNQSIQKMKPMPSPTGIRRVPVQRLRHQKKLGTLLETRIYLDYQERKIQSHLRRICSIPCR